MRDLTDELVLFQLRSVPLFGGCDDRQLRTVAAMSGERRHAVGDVIVTAGGAVRDVPILLDGYASAELDDRPIVVLGPGAVIGGPEALDGALHPLTVVAHTPAVTRVIAASDFAALIADVPPLAIALIRQLGGRTRTVLDELVCARQGSATRRAGSFSDRGASRSSSASQHFRPERRPAAT
ncbi:MAG: Crp/Fnr family transcriptional regulator [Acidimicrobiia bacterium]